VKGKIRNISVAGMLRLLCSYGKTGRFNVNDSDVNGYIDLYQGEITGAGINGRDMKDDCYSAVLRLMRVLGKGIFYFEENDSVSKVPLGISVEKAVIESARELHKDGMGDNADIEDFLFPENEVMKISVMPKNKKVDVVFESDEWNLLAAFSGDVNISAAFKSANVEATKARFILYGLTASGFLRRTRFKIPEISKIARENIGNIGAAIVDNEMRRLNIDRNRMGMKEMIGVLNGLEYSFSEIVGRSKAREVIEKIWSGTK